MTRRRTQERDAALITRRLNEFLDHYAPQFLTSSDHTLKSYEDALTVYFTFLQCRGVTPDTLCRAHLERGWIEDWMVWLREERGNSPQTVNNRLGSLRRFLEYLGSKDASLAYLCVEAKQVKRLKAPKRHVEGMSAVAVEAMLDAPDASTAIGRRDLTFMTTMYGTGARIGEVRSLTWGQLRLDAPRPHVTYVGKGNKARRSSCCPVPRSCCASTPGRSSGRPPRPTTCCSPARRREGP